MDEMIYEVKTAEGKQPRYYYYGPKFWTATSVQGAWDIVNKIVPCDYEQDVETSKRAGYPIHRGAVCYAPYGYEFSISDLNDRLEINCPDGRTINVWIQVERKVVPDVGTNFPQDRYEEELNREFAVDDDDDEAKRILSCELGFDERKIEILHVVKRFTQRLDDGTVETRKFSRVPFTNTQTGFSYICFRVCGRIYELIGTELCPYKEFMA